MKTIHNYIKQIAAASLLLTAMILGACSDDDGGGTPSITNVRVTAKDSTITGGEFNLTVAIQGNNLGSVQKVFFNDVEAYVNPAFVTNSNIIVTIPDDAPSEVNNKITVVTASGESATFEFDVVLPEPVISGVYNEFAKPGEENKVLGNYFFVIETVKVGDTPVEITKSTPTEITFIMPDNVGQETVTVVGAGGTTTTTFRLNETVGNMVNFDIPATGWGSDVCWGDAERIAPENSDIPVLSGKFSRIKQKNLAATGYQGDWVFSTCWFEFGLAPGSHETKMFKFEANIVEAWKAGKYLIQIGTESDGTFVYNFKPWDTDQYRVAGIKTSGWKTFYIPLSEFKKSNDGGATTVEPAVRIPDTSKIRDLRFDFNNGAEGATKIPSLYVAIDNIRIVDL